MTASFPAENVLKIRSPFLIGLGATLFAAAVWLLFRTLRLNYRMETPGTNPYDKSTRERFIYCVWHDSVVIPTFGGKHHCAAALTSLHTDGSFVAHVCRRVGMSTIQGSTNRISPGALRKLLRATEEKHLVVTPDGPRGPRRQMSVGIAYLASRTGRAVAPTAYACSRCWRIPGKWTDLIIPKPFAKVSLVVGNPIKVPQDIDREELKQYAELIQAEMDRLHEEVEGES